MTPACTVEGGPPCLADSLMADETLGPLIEFRASAGDTVSRLAVQMAVGDTPAPIDPPTVPAKASCGDGVEGTSAVQHPVGGPCTTEGSLAGRLVAQSAAAVPRVRVGRWKAG